MGAVRDDYYYRIEDKDGVWKKPKDFHKFLVEHEFIFKDYPSGEDWYKYFGLESPAEFYQLRDMDWSTDLQDLRAKVEAQFGF